MRLKRAYTRFCGVRTKTGLQAAPGVQTRLRRCQRPWRRSGEFRSCGGEEQHDKALTEMAALINQSKFAVPSQLIDYLTHVFKHANAATPEQMQLANNALPLL